MKSLKNHKAQKNYVTLMKESVSPRFLFSTPQVLDFFNIIFKPIFSRGITQVLPSFWGGCF